ncbi:MAG: hypothetical protein GTO51_06240 [Candidatus Latescibacteria bacterium]|nr:hypothetical protein [Candidatus Latescibacterota bacterium]NIM21390.1 hypothetical protein [Candidatus Latescibacterota bacterium]NIM65571.1 hypothetical protein [Candidatus Latescibacterota bacterium]NIO01951.1 hypothetical protein [Candidatus Latescibacterota bacterium]NIO28764.1 hypothetical protein [Candidatus Latescibacterota bacterium]
MKRHFVYVCLFCNIVAFASLARSIDISGESMKQLTSRFPFAIVLEGTKEESARFLYANINQNVHLYRLEKGKLKLEWETTNLGSRVTAFFVKDLYHDGSEELIIGTAGGRILIYELEEYELLWENLQDRFEKVECMTSENIDLDTQDELIFIADSFLYIYDSLNKSLEWQSQGNFRAAEIIVANVDDDEQPEIILNTGFIFDSKFYNIELQTENSFGDRMSLLDINGDGYPEIIGELTNFSLRIFDVYAERELW